MDWNATEKFGTGYQSVVRVVLSNIDICATSGKSQLASFWFDILEFTFTYMLNVLVVCFIVINNQECFNEYKIGSLLHLTYKFTTK